MAKVGKGNKAISVIIPLDVYESLKDWAEARDWSMSQAAKNLIIQGLSEANEPTPLKKKK